MHFRASTCQNGQLKSFTLKIYGKITEDNIRNGPVRWQISTCMNFMLEHFSLAVTVFEIFIFEIFDLEKVGQGHGVQHWQYRSLIANVKIYKHHFFKFWISPRFDLCERFLHTYTHTHTHTYAHRATWHAHGYRHIYRFA